MWVYKIAKIQCVPALIQMFQTKLMGIWEKAANSCRPRTMSHSLCGFKRKDSTDSFTLKVIQAMNKVDFKLISINWPHKLRNLKYGRIYYFFNLNTKLFLSAYFKFNQVNSAFLLKCNWWSGENTAEMKLDNLNEWLIRNTYRFSVI